jgi:hypothetical protein
VAFERLFAHPGGAQDGWSQRGRPDDKLRDNHQLQFATLMNFALQ